MQKRYCWGCMQLIEEDVCPLCGYRMQDKIDSTMYLAPGTQLGKYLIGRVLGQGGFGITYIGRNMENEEIVAIKEYFPDGQIARTIQQTVSVYTGKEEAFEKGKIRFKYEADVLSQFGDFPGIVDYKDYFETNGTAYFVMEYVEGITFKDYIEQKGGTISFQEVVAILMPIMDALGEMHRHEIIHRDISPENIYITRDKHVKLLDFGAARYANSENNQSLSIILKHGYAPKEQYYTRGNQGPWTDIYAVAATAYYALTGMTPQSSLERLEEDKVAFPSRLGADIGPAEEQVLMTAMSIKEKDRYQNIKSFQKALTRAIEGNGAVMPNQVTVTENTTPQSTMSQNNSQQVAGTYSQQLESRPSGEMLQTNMSMGGVNASPNASVQLGQEKKENYVPIIIGGITTGLSFIFFLVALFIALM